MNNGISVQGIQINNYVEYNSRCEIIKKIIKTQ